MMWERPLASGRPPGLEVLPLQRKQSKGILQQSLLRRVGLKIRPIRDCDYSGSCWEPTPAQPRLRLRFVNAQIFGSKPRFSGQSPALAYTMVRVQDTT